MNAYMHSSYLNCSSINKNLVVRNQDQNLIKIQGTAEGQSPDPTLHVFLVQNDLEIYPLHPSESLSVLIKLPQSSNIYILLILVSHSVTLSLTQGGFIGTRGLAMQAVLPQHMWNFCCCVTFWVCVCLDCFCFALNS